MDETLAGHRALRRRVMAAAVATFAGATLLTGAAQGQIVRCEQAGKVTYQESRCPAGAAARPIDMTNASVRVPVVDVAALGALMQRERAEEQERRERAVAAQARALAAAEERRRAQAIAAQYEQADALRAIANELRQARELGYAPAAWQRPGRSRGLY